MTISSRANADFEQWICAIVMLVCFFVTPLANAQEHVWPGRWQARYQPWPHIPEITMTLHIAAPAKGMLFPASLELSYGNFEGRYELLLVKKNDRQLGIGRNKYPITETPFQLGPWMMYLNGVLDNAAAADTMVLQRVWLDNMGIFMNGVYDDEIYTNTKVFIRDFLYRSDVRLAKVDDEPWPHANTRRVLHSDSIYYGVYDPIMTDTDWLSFFLQDEERYDRDSVTVVHNGQLLVNGLPVDRAMSLDSIRLDTGQNYIAFFADNYGDIPPNTATFVVGTTGREAAQYQFDFSDRSNAYATVMVGSFVYTPSLPAEDIDIRERKKSHTALTRTHGRRDITIGSWRIDTNTIFLELWDGQVEDGDIISLEVNGARIADRLEVTKRIKKLGVTLSPGVNRLVFTAENLGRIPPNTAILQVTARDEARRFYLNTNFERNNVLQVIIP